MVGGKWCSGAGETQARKQPVGQLYDGYARRITLWLEHGGSRWTSLTERRCGRKKTVSYLDTPSVHIDESRV